MILRRLLRIATLSLAFLALQGTTLRAQAPILTMQTTNPQSGDFYYYGPTLYIGFMGFGVAVPLPGPAETKYFSTDSYAFTDLGLDPTINLTDNAAYHNGTMYGRALAKSNTVRGVLWKQKIGSSKKIVAPMTGKGPTSLSFWDWIKVGETSLKLYGKMRAMVRALQSGMVTIDMWKLMPKLGLLNSDDPDTPALFLGIAPADTGPMGMIRNLTDWTDPRYKLSSKANFSNISSLVPSLGVKPSFFGALAHLQTNDASGGQLLMARLSRNTHELMTTLSMIRRNLVGGAADPSKRWTSQAQVEGVLAYQEKVGLAWEELGAEMSRAVALGDPAMAKAFRDANTPLWKSIQSAEVAGMMDAASRRQADQWAARALAGEMDNLTGPLESKDYMDFIDNIEEMVEEGATSKLAPVAGEESLAELRLTAADAGVNRLLRDEFRAIRQLFAMQARREIVDVMAPSIAQGMSSLNEGSRRLGRLNNLLERLQKGQSAATAVLGAGDAAKILQENFVISW